MLIGAKINSKQFVISDNFMNGYQSNYSRLNVFIGVNNSGKSQFLRYIFSNIKRQDLIFEQDWRNVINQSFVDQANNNIRQANKSLKVAGAKLLNSNKVLDDAVMRSDESRENIYTTLNLINLLENIHVSSFDSSLVNNTYVTRAVHSFNRIGIDFSSKFGQSTNKIKVEFIYIPVLRGLRPIQKNGSVFTNVDCYKDRTLFDYFNEKESSGKEIYTGLSLYEDVKKLLLGSEQERILIQEFQDFLSEVIFEEKVLLIPKYDDDVLHIKIGKKKQREIFNLGDGLQSMIVILFTAFKNKNRPACIFIEEPELHLHPKWQRKLIQALLLLEEHQYFLSTHSATFLNTYEDTSIFKVSRKGVKSIIKNTRLNKDRANMLNELGYLASDLFQTNYILWVEGPSDKEYIMKWVSLIDDNLIHGVHYTVLFFGGSNYKNLIYEDDLISVEELSKINQNFGVLMDSDKTNPYHPYPEDKKRIKEQFEALGFFCWVTKYREIENYIPWNLFKETVLETHRIKEIELKDGKYENRNKLVNLDESPTFKSSIKLTQDLFTIIQKNGNGKTNGISSTKLREGIEDAIAKTRKSEFSINKLAVAKNISLKMDDNYDWQGESKAMVRKLCDIIWSYNR